MIVGIHHSEREEWLAATDICEADRVCDERHLTQDGQRTYLSDIEEAFRAAAGEEVLVEEIEQVVTSERQGHQLALLEINGEESRKIQRRYRELRSIGARDHRGGVHRVDRAGSPEQRPPKSPFAFDLRRPVLPAGEFAEIELELGLRGRVVLAAGLRSTRRHALKELRERAVEHDAFVFPSGS